MTDSEIEPTTESGRRWREAEELARKLKETGDTPKSFLIKGAIGCLGIAGFVALLIWGVIAVIRLL